LASKVFANRSPQASAATDYDDTAFDHLCG